MFGSVATESMVEYTKPGGHGANVTVRNTLHRGSQQLIL